MITLGNNLLRPFFTTKKLTPPCVNYSVGPPPFVLSGLPPMSSDKAMNSPLATFKPTSMTLHAPVREVQSIVWEASVGRLQFGFTVLQRIH